MIDIIVARLPADKQGPDIQDSLITSIPAALARGQMEIDDHSDLQPLKVTILYKTGLKPGILIDVHDAIQGASWVGKIEGVHFTSDGDMLLAELDMVKP